MKKKISTFLIFTLLMSVLPLSNVFHAKAANVTDVQTGVYRIVSVLSGKSLDVSGGSMQVGLNMQQWDNNNSLAQSWYVKNNADGTYSMIAGCSNQALSATPSSTSHVTQQFYDSSEPKQKFTLDAVGDGSYYIRLSTDQSYVFDVNARSTDNGGQIIAYQFNGNRNQRWKLEKLSDVSVEVGSVYTIQNMNSGLVLDVPASSSATGLGIIQYPSTGNPNQQWIPKYEGNGSISFMNVATSKVLTVNGYNNQITQENGVNYAPDNQKFNVTRASAGYSLITNPASNLVFDMAGFSKDACAKLIGYSSNSTVNQQWKFTKVADSYAALLRNSRMTAARWDYSKWMEGKYDSLKDKALNAINLPGTHDSGTYNLDAASQDMANSHDALDGTPLSWVSPVIDNVIYHFSKAQEATIKNQLVEGNRYLDFRLKKDSTGNIRFYHGSFGDDYKLGIQDINNFLRANTKEVVILDLQDFNNLSNDEVTSVGNYINSLMGDIIASADNYSATSTYGSLVANNKRLIVLSRGSVLPYTQSFGSKFWVRSTNVVSNWGNTAVIDNLISYENNDLATNRSSSEFYVAQLVMPLNPGDMFNVFERCKNDPGQIVAAVLSYIPYMATSFTTTTLESLIRPNQPTIQNWIKTNSNLNINMLDFYTKDLIDTTINKN